MGVTTLPDSICSNDWHAAAIALARAWQGRASGSAACLHCIAGRRQPAAGALLQIQ
eukprot:CAMPEP_0115739704 /NCGR_PEP_ID=MMETSP0272-20121206/89094_1 /TAXON_ID=71861 /ORGANISM="Scrippsiella trochoidea, Strain CCMP3099" /LENGTH=55 /DNA_ID=CAMNT_0003184293 /DNA_START=118 /DNA_END=285 /DNA_ORIENTATION=-